MPSQFSLEKAAFNKNCSIYKITPSFGKTEAYIATTPYTRAICNDPKVCGITYTNLLKKACTEILSLMPIEGVTEADAMVANILRGGLNFGLRDALADAYGWNHHTTCFLSAQRAQSPVDGTWHITENSYKKLYFPCATSLYIGDVVATGTSLEYGLNELVDAAIEHKTNLRNIYLNDQLIGKIIKETQPAKAIFATRETAEDDKRGVVKIKAKHLTATNKKYGALFTLSPSIYLTSHIWNHLK